MDGELFLGHRPFLISLCISEDPYFPLLRWLLSPDRLPLGLSGVVCGPGPELALSFSTYPAATFTCPRPTACRGGTNSGYVVRVPGKSFGAKPSNRRACGAERGLAAVLKRILKLPF